MVYVPFEAVKHLMLQRWREKKTLDPDTPPPTISEIRIEWFKILDWVPENYDAFERLKNQFPLEDRKRIFYTRYDNEEEKVKRRGR